MKKLVVLLLIFALAVGMTGCEKEGENANKESILAENWLLQQDSLESDLQEVMEFSDQVYSLYIGNKMSAQDFLNQLQIGQARLFTIQHDYEERKSQYIFDAQSDETALQGVDALETFFIDANKLFVSSFRETGEAFLPIEVAYIYMNYKEKLEDEYIRYLAIVIAIKDVKGELSSADTDEHQTESEVSAG